MDTPDLALRLGLALAIGFLVGLERGWRERDEEEGSRTAGLRTFSLIGLLGGVFGALSLNGDRIFLAAGFLTLGGALGAFMWREGEHRHDFSATSLVAALLTFALGALALLGDIRVAAGAGVAAVILLANKQALHGWLERITWIELRAGLLLAAMSFIALPLLPHRTVDPWNALNPHELWLMTVSIAAVSFAGYAAVKIAGPERGILIAAATGGIFASTAVTLSLARMAGENPARARLLAGGILLAGGVMMLRVVVVTSLFNAALALALAPVLFAAAAGMAVAAALVARLQAEGSGSAGGFALTNPFDLGQVLRFGLLLAAVMLASVLARRAFGDPGLLGLAALSGLADVDALTLSVARLGEVSPTAIDAILLAVTANSAAKCAYALYAGGIRVALLAGLGTALAAVAALPVWLWS